jgi:hypothetical protein
VGLALVASVMLAACGGNEEGTADAGASPDERIEAAAAAAARRSGVHFEKGISKRACEILTPAMVAETFDVPESELRQMKMMGCIYSWKRKDAAGETILEANLTMLRAHETEEGARTWLENATANKTNEEVRDEMKQVTEKAREDDSIDTELKKETVDTMGGLMAQALPKDGFRYEPVAGIGDEARVALNDGAIWARVGNLTFTVSAYKGAPQPKPDFDMSDMKDLQKLTRKATEAQHKWLKEKHDERKAAATKLARRVVEALP